jgi:predicted TIM-barrel fold metal-dependent hydrolase
MSKKWGSAVPHVRYVPEQDSEWWFVQDLPVMHVGFSVIGKSADGSPERHEDAFPHFITKFEDMHPSAWDPTERAKVMDSYGISAQALYPNLGFVGPDIYRVLPGSTLEFQLSIAQCYNDWILEWEHAEPHRFISQACIPYWDIASAVSEVERCAALGHRGFVMTGTPEGHGEPMLSDPHWNPLWAAIEAVGLPVSFHAGGGGAQYREKIRARIELNGGLAAQTLNTTITFFQNASVAAELVMSGILPNFPKLRFVVVESGVGWIPFMLESLDKHFVQYRVDREHPEFEEKPSFYFHRQVFVNSWFEQLGQWHVDSIGGENMLFETDYPHPTCLIGQEIGDAIKSSLGQLDEQSRQKILWSNAVSLYELDEEALSAIGQLAVNK